jgi:hypothetical protein
MKQNFFDSKTIVALSLFTIGLGTIFVLHNTVLKQPEKNTKTEIPTPQKQHTTTDFATTNDTLYVIRTQYTHSKHHNKQCWCIDQQGKQRTENCPDFTEPGDTLVIQDSPQYIFKKTKNITLERKIQEYAKQY